VLDPDRQHLLGQAGRALRERVGQLAVGLPPQLDAVADLQAAALARVLHQAHRLAHEPGPPQLGVMSRSSATVSPAPLATAQPVRGVSVTTTSSGDSATGSPSTTTDAVPARRSAASQPRRRTRPRRHRLHALAEALAERPEVGLGGHVDEVARERLERDDVELGRHQRLQLRRQVLPALRRDHRPAERLAGLHPGLRARLPPEVDQPAHERHLRRQPLVDERARRPAASARGAPSRPPPRRTARPTPAR
jgi:hypothetical protein